MMVVAAVIRSIVGGAGACTFFAWGNIAGVHHFVCLYRYCDGIGCYQQTNNDVR